MVLLCGEGTSTVSRTCEKLTELSTTTKNECFAMDLRTKEVVLRLNVTQNPQ